MSDAPAPTDIDHVTNDEDEPSTEFVEAPR